MRVIVCCLLLLSGTLSVRAQSYSDSILQFRRHYAEELLADKRAPLKHSQINSLAFFTPDHKYCVWADFTETPGSKPFLVQTHSGKQKPFREYGKLTFSIHDTLLTLHVYQIVDLLNDAAHKDDLFIPFNDLTNYETTYAGGRYIDLTTNNISNGRVLLDFNKCYNPYCAYADGYSCPIPPSENYLHIPIRAGEKLFIQ